MEKNETPAYTYRLNALLEMQNNLDVMESKIYYLGLANINPHVSSKDKYFDTEFKMLHIPTEKLVEEFGHTQYLTIIKKTCLRMLKKTVEMSFENGDWEGYTVFKHIKYKHNDGLYLQFNDDMKPFLLDIFHYSGKYGFTRIDMKQIINLSSKHAIRILEMLLQYRGEAIKKGKTIIEKEFDIEYIRKYLNIANDKYTIMSNFRKRVIEEPCKSINENTRYYITAKTIKYSKKITGFSFTCDFSNVPSDIDFNKTIEAEAIKEEKDIPKDIPLEEQLEREGQGTLFLSIPEQKEKDKLYKKLHDYGFNLDTIGILFEDYCGGDINELKARLEYGERRAHEDKQKKKLKKNSLSGYLLKAIKQNWLGEKKQEEQAQTRELEATATNADWDAWARDAMGDDPAPDVPERPLDPNDPMHQSIIGMIKKEIKDRNISQTTKDIFKKRGLTFQRFRELYMR